MTLDRARIEEIARGTEGVPDGPWSAHMDDYTLHVARGSFIPDNYTLALCATGEHAGYLVRYLASVDPQTVSELCRLALIGLRAEQALTPVLDQMRANLGERLYPNQEQSQ